MFQVRCRKWAALAAAAGVCGIAGWSTAAEPTQQELMSEVTALKARLGELEATQQRLAGGGTAPEQQATIASVLKDAELRSAVDPFALRPLSLQTGVTDLPAGHDKGKFFIRSSDGDFSFSPTFQFQFRYVGNYREGEGGDDGGDALVDDGFELRRTKFGAEGKAFDKFEYKFVWATDRSGGVVRLQDAVVKYELADDFNFFMGQFKDPVHHEELVSSGKQLSADRSLVNELLGGGVTDRVQGVGMEYKQGQWEIFAALHDGRNSDNTSFRGTQGGNPSDYGAAARVEYVLFGDKKYYGDFTALGNTGSMMAIGGGVDFSGQQDSNGLAYTVDWQYEFDRVALYAAFLGNNQLGHGDAGDFNDFGGLVQAAYMMSPKMELFGRYGLVSLDDDALDDGDADDIHEIVFGTNYYLEGHKAKITADVTFLPNGSPGNSGLGIIDSGDDSQFVGRLQFQLLI